MGKVRQHAVAAVVAEDHRCFVFIILRFADIFVVVVVVVVVIVSDIVVV